MGERVIGSTGDRQSGRDDQAARAGASEELDPRGVSAGGCQSRVPCHAGSRQSLREGDVCRIVRREGLPECPDPGQQDVVRIATQGQRGEVLQRLGAARGVELPGERASAQDLGYLDIQQAGGGERLSGGKKAVGRSAAGRVFSKTSSTAEASTTITGALARLGPPGPAGRGG